MLWGSQFLRFVPLYSCLFPTLRWFLKRLFLPLSLQFWFLFISATPCNSLSSLIHFKFLGITYLIIKCSFSAQFNMSALKNSNFYLKSRLIGGETEVERSSDHGLPPRWMQCLELLPGPPVGAGTHRLEPSCSAFAVHKQEAELEVQQQGLKPLLQAED